MAIFLQCFTFYSFLRIELSDNKKIPNFQEKIKVFQDMVQHIKIDKKNARTGYFAVQNAWSLFFAPFETLLSFCEMLILDRLDASLFWLELGSFCRKNMIVFPSKSSIFGVCSKTNHKYSSYQFLPAEIASIFYLYWAIA